MAHTPFQEVIIARTSLACLVAGLLWAYDPQQTNTKVYFNEKGPHWAD
jgi:hypothetical protein